MLKLCRVAHNGILSTTSIIRKSMNIKLNDYKIIKELSDEIQWQQLMYEGSCQQRRKYCFVLVKL